MPGICLYDVIIAELKRIAWRLEYTAKRNRKREISYSDEQHLRFERDFSSDVFVQELINDLPTKGKSIVSELIFAGKTEKQVAEQFNISQQAVSKWKKKMFSQLHQTLDCLS